MCSMQWPDMKIFAMTKNTAPEQFSLHFVSHSRKFAAKYVLLFPFTMLTVRINSGQTRRFQLGFSSKIYL